MLTTKTKFYVPVELSLNELIKKASNHLKGMTPKLKSAWYRYMATKWDPLRHKDKTKFEINLEYGYSDGSINIFIPINDLDHLLLTTNTNHGMKKVNRWLFSDFVFIPWREVKNKDFFCEDLSEWSDDDIILFFENDKECKEFDLIEIDRAPRGGILLAWIN